MIQIGNTSKIRQTVEILRYHYRTKSENHSIPHNYANIRAKHMKIYHIFILICLTQWAIFFGKILGHHLIMTSSPEDD